MSRRLRDVGIAVAVVGVFAVYDIVSAVGDLEWVEREIGKETAVEIAKAMENEGYSWMGNFRNKAAANIYLWGRSVD